MIRVGPADRDHLIAMRAAVSVAVPLLTLFAFDRLDLAVYASFGEIGRASCRERV